MHRVHAADSREPIEIPGLVYAFSVTQHMYRTCVRTANTCLDFNQQRRDHTYTEIL